MPVFDGDRKYNLSRNEKLGRLNLPQRDVRGERGEKGERGEAPIKGVEYFTEVEKSEMVDEVAALIVQDRNYVHNQTIASLSWNIVHNLGKFPSVMILEEDGTPVIGDVTFVDTNTVHIGFTVAFVGKAYLN